MSLISYFNKYLLRVTSSTTHAHTKVCRTNGGSVLRGLSRCSVLGGSRSGTRVPPWFERTEPLGGLIIFNLAHRVICQRDHPQFYVLMTTCIWMIHSSSVPPSPLLLGANTQKTKWLGYRTNNRVRFPAEVTLSLRHHFYTGSSTNQRDIQLADQRNSLYFR